MRIGRGTLQTSTCPAGTLYQSSLRNRRLSTRVRNVGLSVRRASSARRSVGGGRVARRGETRGKARLRRVGVAVGQRREGEARGRPPCRPCSPDRGGATRPRAISPTTRSSGEIRAAALRAPPRTPRRRRWLPRRLSLDIPPVDGLRVRRRTAVLRRLLERVGERDQARL